MSPEERAALTPKQREDIVKDYGHATYQSARFAIREAIDASNLPSDKLLVLVVPADTPLYKELSRQAGGPLRSERGEMDVFVLPADRETFAAFCVKHEEEDATWLEKRAAEDEAVLRSGKTPKRVAKKDIPRVKPYVKLGQVLARPPSPGAVWTAVFLGSHYAHTLIAKAPPLTREEEAAEKAAKAAEKAKAAAEAAAKAAAEQAAKEAAQLAAPAPVAAIDAPVAPAVAVEPEPPTAA